jgi:LPS-assembly lipoprotein
MRLRRLAFALALTAPGMCPGCGWTPMYADRATTPASADLRAIKVDAISERIGQRLEMALRTSLNPTGIPTPVRYELKTTIAVVRSDLGLQSQGLATRGQVDVFATFVLTDLATKKMLLTNTIHVSDSFDILANGYATVVTEDDARTRTVEELRAEIAARLTMFMQRRQAVAGS